MWYDKCEGYSDSTVHDRFGGDKELRGFVAGRWSFPIGEEVHCRIVDNCIGEEVAADVTAARVPLEELDVGNEYAKFTSNMTIL